MNTAQQAVENERTRATAGTDVGVGNCLGNTRDCYGSPATGGSAATAYAATTLRHGVYDTPPLGALVWFTGGSQGFGHVGISNGEGYFWNTDFGPNGYIGDGRVRLIPIAAVNQHDPALKYVGWTEDLDGERVLDMTDADWAKLRSMLVEVVGTVLWGLNPAGGADPLGFADTGSWATAIQSDNVKAQADRIVAAVNATPAAASSGAAPSAQDIATAVAAELDKRLAQ